MTPGKQAPDANEIPRQATRSRRISSAELFEEAAEILIVDAGAVYVLSRERDGSLRLKEIPGASSMSRSGRHDGIETLQERKAV